MDLSQFLGVLRSRWKFVFMTLGLGALITAVHSVGGRLLGTILQRAPSKALGDYGYGYGTPVERNAERQDSSL